MAAPSHECQAEACAIQACIQKNKYDESKCTAAIKALYSCCAAMYARDPSAKSDSCPLVSVVKRKMKQLEAEGA